MMPGKTNKRSAWDRRTMKGSRYISGFTLIEMLVVISIISVMSLVVVAKYRQSQPNYLMLQAVQQLQSNIHNAQNMAMNGVGVAEGGAYGYGIYFEKNQTDYILFKENDGTYKYKDNPSPHNEDVDVSRIILPNNITISKLEVYDDTRSRSNVTYLYIVFESPDPATHINKGAGGNFEEGFKTAKITLRDQKTGVEKIVEFNVIPPVAGLPAPYSGAFTSMSVY